MSRTYSVIFANTSVSVAVDLFQIKPADDKPCRILGMFLSQVGVGDVGDTSEELLNFSIVRGNTSDGSGGTAPTPQLIDPNDPAASFTARVLDTTQASAGTPVTLHSDGFNVRMQNPIILPENMRWSVTQAQTILAVRLVAAPADAITLTGTLYVEEY